MSYAILRTKKLKMGGAGASLKHNFREQQTLNADPSLTPTNDNNGPQTTDQAMGKLRDILPDKRRKDAVVAIEYLMTTSPEWAEKATPKEQTEFFRRSLDWLIKKHGAENIVVASTHNDEKTPHMAAYVVPISNTNPEKPNRLCAKDFLGGREMLSQMQTDFAEQVEDLGLKRGIKGSTAKHQRIKQHYAQLNQGEAEPTLEISPDDLVKRERKVEVEVQVEDKSFLSKVGIGKPKPKTEIKTERRIENDIGVSRRLNEKIQQSTAPLAAKARERDAAVKQAFTATQTAEKLQETADVHRMMVKGLGIEELEKLVYYSEHLRQEKIQKAEREHEFQQMIENHDKAEEQHKRAQYRQEIGDDTPKVKGPKLGI